ncbi:MAG: MoaD/ThiS family protein [archaeon GB-1867-035]|nr:MoaD/ThiS family protein [Candidatus Culexmicrobium profundum]
MTAEIEVKVKFLSTLRDIVGVREASIIVSKNATLADVLNVLKEKWPRLHVIDVESEGPIIMLLNGVAVKLDTPVRENDEIVLMPPASGGL